VERVPLIEIGASRGWCEECNETQGNFFGKRGLSFLHEITCRTGQLFVCNFVTEACGVVVCVCVFLSIVKKGKMFMIIDHTSI
jgi:hypothetical protein